VIEYAVKAAGAWFLGFFPLAEIYVAVPAAMAAGLDDLSVLFWTVLGNFTPVVLIHVLYDWLIARPRIGAWLSGLVSERARARIDRWGTPVVLLITPWVGVWAMTVTAKVARMNAVRFFLAAFISISVYVVILVLSLRFGADQIAAL
jgi:hypothetical protein